MRVSRTFVSLFLLLFLTIGASWLTSCSSSKGSARAEEREREREREREEEEEEGREYRPTEAQLPADRDITIHLDPFEGHADTLRFHIGSPFFIRMRVDGNRTDGLACEAFDGRPFYFDAGGSQLGWGFEEVADSLLFPRGRGVCDRVIMLSSDASNRIAEGNYTLTVTVFLEAKKHLYSDTLYLQAVRSGGADDVSYTRFLQEQIVRNSPLLRDPETLRALFSDGAPRSAESEIYRALVYFRGGDRNQAQLALESATNLEAQRNRPVTGGTDEVRTAVNHALHGEGIVR